MLLFDSDNLLRFMKMVKPLPEFEYFTVFLNNTNFFFQNEKFKSYRLCSFKDLENVMGSCYAASNLNNQRCTSQIFIISICKTIKIV